MGGGEKVLFQAISALQAVPNFDNDTILVYSGATMDPADLCKAVKDKFGTDINLSKNNLQFVKLTTHETMLAANYPSWTLFWQLIAYNSVCAESLRAAPCDMFIDTIGVGFAYPLVKLFFGCKVISYTHYPTISSDMLKQINTDQFNNKVSSSPVLKLGKYIYYRILMVLYSLCGFFVD